MGQVTRLLPQLALTAASGDTQRTTRQEPSRWMMAYRTVARPAASVLAVASFWGPAGVHIHAYIGDRLNVRNCRRVRPGLPKSESCARSRALGMIAEARLVWVATSSGVRPPVEVA